MRRASGPRRATEPVRRGGHERVRVALEQRERVTETARQPFGERAAVFGDNGRPTSSARGRRAGVRGGVDSLVRERGDVVGRRRERYLVDPASSHMLVSKIKPCMSKYKPRTRRDCGRLIKSVTTPLGPDSYVDNVR